MASVYACAKRERQSGKSVDSYYTWCGVEYNSMKKLKVAIEQFDSIGDCVQPTTKKPHKPTAADSNSQVLPLYFFLEADLCSLESYIDALTTF